MDVLYTLVYRMYYDTKYVLWHKVCTTVYLIYFVYIRDVLYTLVQRMYYDTKYVLWHKICTGMYTNTFPLLTIRAIRPHPYMYIHSACVCVSVCVCARVYAHHISPSFACLNSAA
jgi:hypothetical protein